MRAPLSWIRDFTPLAAPVPAIADALNQLGLEVDSIDDPGAEISGVVVARITNVVAHPDADKIRLAEIVYGDGKELRVVCGAPNISAGMVVPFATVGARLPGGFEITKRKIRGIVSEGMLCSTRELGLGDDHAGILELPTDSQLGADVRELLGLDDVIFELSITPNRPDAMGIVGIARELSAHFKLDFSVPAPDVSSVVKNLGDVTVSIEALDRCPRFVSRTAEVVVAESPDWLQKRLRLAGMRPINNIVDVTNYVMLERCRPLHAFDLNHLEGRGIVVRLADNGERMVTLDGVERLLTDSDLLICDAGRKPQAIAGIMGGRDAEVSNETTAILLESAHFEPGGISRSSKRLGLRSEASARFERGVDPNGAAEGADCAISLLAMVAKVKPDAGKIDVYPNPVDRPRIYVRTARVNKVLGTSLEASEVSELLGPLGIEILDGSRDFDVATPTWRPDLTREIDVVEEVARRVGLANIARTVASAPAGTVGRLTVAQRERRLIADVLVGAGVAEAMTMPLVSPSDLETAGLVVEDVVELTNPLRAEESLLRPSLRSGMLRATANNFARGETDVALFEIGTVFYAPQRGSILPNERVSIGVVLAGASASLDMLIRVLRSLESALRLESLELIGAELNGLHPGRGAEVVATGTVIGALGEVAPSVAAGYGLDRPLWLEIDLRSLLAAPRRSLHIRSVSQYPPINMDLAFVVPDSVPAAKLSETIRHAGGEMLEQCLLFDEFRSSAIGESHRSLAYALRFRSPSRTLTDHDVTPLREAIINAVFASHAAVMRA